MNEHLNSKKSCECKLIPKDYAHCGDWTAYGHNDLLGFLEFLLRNKMPSVKKTTVTVGQGYTYFTIMFFSEQGFHPIFSIISAL